MPRGTSARSGAENAAEMETEPSLPETHASETPIPRSPLSFSKEALSGGLNRSAMHFCAAWVALQLIPAALWARHLRVATGSSALPSFWGEQLQVTDLWELIHHGGLEHAPFGALVPWVFGILTAWMLWAGWRHQAEAAGLPPRFSAWTWGLLEGLALAIIPITLLTTLLRRALGWAASSGIEGLGWTELVGTVLLTLCVPSVVLLQAWLCRLSRAEATPGWRFGSWAGLGRHLGRSFLRLWLHPVDWTLLVVGGILLRGAGQAFALWLAWRWGGSGLGKVWTFIGLEALVAAGNALLLAWFLRLVARYWRHDHHLRQEIRALEHALPPGAHS